MKTNKFGDALKQSETRTQQAINGNPEQMTANSIFTPSTEELRNNMEDTLAKMNEYGYEMKGARIDLPKRFHRIIENIQDNLSVRGRKDLHKDEIIKIALIEFVQNHPEICEG